MESGDRLQSGGKITFKIDSQGPISVIFIKENGYKALLTRNADALQKTDIILNVPSAPSPYEKTVTAPAGSSWFIIQNLSDKSVEMRLRCHAN
jgi:hypothetical protein